MLFDGDIARVITDNRFNVDNAARPSFSPYVYPWGWPLLLSPFVRLFGLRGRPRDRGSRRRRTEQFERRAA